MLLDHDTADYIHGFDAIRRSLAPGGTILADNVVIHGDIQTPAGLLATLDGDPAPNDRTRVVAAFYEYVLLDPGIRNLRSPGG